MTQTAFFKFCETSLGLTDLESKDWWKDMLSNPQVERDNGGFKGRQQLWVPVGKKRSRGSESGVQDEVQEGGNQLKGATPHDVKVLKDHTKNLDASFADELFVLRACGSGTGSCPPSEDAEGEGAVDKKPRTLKPERDAPRFHKAMQSAMEKLQKAREKSTCASDAAVKVLHEIPEDDKQKDKALNSYTSTLQLHAQIFMKFEGNTDVVKLFNIYQPPASSGGPPPPPLIPSFVPDIRAAIMAPATPAASAPGTPMATVPHPSPSKPILPVPSKAASVCLTDEYIQITSMKRILQDFPLKKPFATDPEMAMTLSEMEFHVGEVTDCEDSEALNSHMVAWEDAIKIAVAIVNAMSMSSITLVRHAASQGRDKTRKEKQLAQERQTAQLKKIRDGAKQQAEAIKAKHNAASKIPASKVFLAEFTIPEIPGVAILTEVQPLSYLEPFVLRSVPAVDTWLSDHTVQKGLTSFAAGYRKKAETGGGRTQSLMEVKQGRTITLDMLKAWQPPEILDIGANSSIDGGSTFMEGMWIFGFSPDMMFCGFTPNNCAMLRVLALGEIKLLLIHIQSLIKVDPEFKNLDYLDNLKNLDTEALRALAVAGVSMRHVTQLQGDMLYIPAGYLMIESCVVGHNLVYGVRKSFMMKGGEGSHALAYAVTTDLFRNSGRNCDRMDLISGTMKA